MELRRPFSDEDFQATPEPVQRYIIQLENVVIKLLQETEDLKKRVTELENKLNQNSQNSSKPPSSDPPFKRPPKKKKKKKGKRKRGGQKGHKGNQQKLMEPTKKVILFPETCSCGCSSFDPDSLMPFYTHQVIELPTIENDVLHFILNQGRCTQCGNIVKAQLPNERQTGYGPRLSALIAEVSGINGGAFEVYRPGEAHAIAAIIDDATDDLEYLVKIAQDTEQDKDDEIERLNLTIVDLEKELRGVNHTRD